MKRRVFIWAAVALVSTLAGEVQGKAKPTNATKHRAAKPRSSLQHKTRKKPSGKQVPHGMPHDYATLGAPKKKPAHQHVAHVQLYKNRGLACCEEWAEHLRTHGFTVNTDHVDNPAHVGRQHGVPKQLGACHTALVDGYVIEGHVPAEEIKRLVKTRPSVVGLAVPGMPAGSPGLGGEPAQAYNVVLLRKDGQHVLYRHYPA